jgi:diaminohydroxyphosphoribosylaminopyrimidine deaminase / 5-amino-6-(5-phosphoribosylamino)uracil reductase
MTSDETFMARALELAASVPFTAPNPRVGAVVVRDGEIIGEGAHRGAGTPHAEAIALDGVDAAGATLYVTLEPCSHQGRMPPCAPMVADAGVTRVVAAMEDPDPKVDGAGFALLQKRGITVEVGLLAEEAERLNAGFVSQRTTGRPLVTLKLALSLDGRFGHVRDAAIVETIAGVAGHAYITGEPARARVHERRRQADAVVVGSGTVLADDPELTVRMVPATRQPARVILDGRGRVPADRKVFGRDAEVVVVTTDAAPHEAQLAWKEAGAEVVVVPAGKSGGVDLDATVETFGRRGWHELYFEAGPTLASALFAAGLVGRVELHIAPVVLGDGAPLLGDIGSEGGAGRRFRVTRVEELGDDVVLELMP